ncbi:hypothetical protein ACWJJH_03580 [Endozoicomonadaceae bacterium StTr2]
MLKALKTCKFSLFFLCLFLSITAHAGGKLLGIPYASDSQYRAILYYIASLPPGPVGSDIVMVPNSSTFGFGIYEFHFRLEDILQEDAAKPWPIKRIVMTEEKEVAAVKRIFDFPKTDYDLLLLEDDDEDAEVLLSADNAPETVQQALQWIRDSGLIITLVNELEDELLDYPEIHHKPYLFINTLLHLEDLDKWDLIEAEYEAMTAAIFSGSTLSMAESFRHLGGKEFTDLQYETYSSLANQPAVFFINRALLTDTLASEFGVRSHQIGFLLNNPHSAQFYLNHISLMSDELWLALYGTSDPLEGMRMLQQQPPYFSYMHTLFSNLQFLQTLVLAADTPEITVIMKLEPEDFEDPLVAEALAKVNVGTVSYWSAKSGERNFSIQAVEPSQQSEVKLRIINPFPLDSRLFQSLGYYSQPVVGTTGELSLFRMLSMGKIPFHEWMTQQRFLNQDLADVARAAGTPILAEFFELVEPAGKASALRRVLATPENMEAYLNYLRSRHNASAMLKSLIRATMEDDSLMWKGVAQIEAARATDAIQSLPSELHDLAIVRHIFSQIKKLDYLDYTPRHKGVENPDYFTNLQALRATMKEQAEAIQMAALRTELLTVLAGLNTALTEDEFGPDDATGEEEDDGTQDDDEDENEDS